MQEIEWMRKTGPSVPQLDVHQCTTPLESHIGAYPLFRFLKIAYTTILLPVISRRLASSIDDKSRITSCSVASRSDEDVEEGDAAESRAPKLHADREPQVQDIPSMEYVSDCQCCVAS